MGAELLLLSLHSPMATWGVVGRDRTGRCGVVPVRLGAWPMVLGNSYTASEKLTNGSVALFKSSSRTRSSTRKWTSSGCGTPVNQTAPTRHTMRRNGHAGYGVRSTHCGVVCSQQCHCSQYRSNTLKSRDDTP